MKQLFLMLLLVPYSVARENPFLDAVPEGSFPISTNKPEVLDSLRKESLKLPSSARAIKRVIVEYQNLDGSIDKVLLNVNKQIDWHEPIVISHKTIKKSSHKEKYRLNIKLDFIKFFTAQKRMKILTKNSMLRHFILSKPYRIVLDFKRNGSFLSKKYSNFSKPFKEVRLGNHKGYYRVVIQLDGQYLYKIKSSSSGIIITVK